MKKRLLEFLSYLGIGQTKFEERVGLSRGLINNIKGDISLKSLNKIVAHYPELNVNWLQTGEGEMLKSGAVQIGSRNFANISGGHNVAGNVSGGAFAAGIDAEKLLAENEQLKAELQRVTERADRLAAENLKLIERVSNLMDRILK